LPDPGTGVLTLFEGTPSGLERLAAWIVRPPVVDAAYGSSVASAGDVNGDGYANVLVGARDLPGVAVPRGRRGLRPLPDWTVETGWVVASAGDVDGDGYDDVVVPGHGPLSRRVARRAFRAVGAAWTKRRGPAPAGVVPVDSMIPTNHLETR
jgi:hypothetical protein